MQTKYKKSDTCVICGKQMFNGKRDRNFLCLECEKEIKNYFLDLLKDKSGYIDNIKDISLFSASSWGSSQKTMIIKIGYDYGRNIYVRIPTSKVLEIKDLNNDYLLINYLDSEIKVQYILQDNKIDKEIEDYKRYCNKDDNLENKDGIKDE